MLCRRSGTPFACHDTVRWAIERDTYVYNSCNALSKTSHHYLRGARRAFQQTVRPGAGVASALAIGDILSDPVRFSVSPRIIHHGPIERIFRLIIPLSRPCPHRRHPCRSCHEMRCPPPHLAACSEPVSVRRPPGAAKAAYSARDSSSFSSTDWLIVCSYVGAAMQCALSGEASGSEATIPAHAAARRARISNSLLAVAHRACTRKQTVSTVTGCCRRP
jgi:hypothetical protein